MSSDHAAQPAVTLTRGRRRAITTGLLLGIFLAALEATVVSTAMPTVVTSLGGLEHYSWVFSAYLLTSTAAVPLWGRLSDLYGRRRVYLASIALFLIGSMLAGVSQSMLQLILFRALQGLGAGGLIPLALTIIGEIYTLAERTRMQAVFSSVWGFASIAGPLVGGFITDTISWRWIFYLNVPIGLVAATIVHRTVPEHARAGKVVVDWLGGALLFASTTLLLVALAETSLVWGLVALVSAAAFVHVERGNPHAIVPLALFRNRAVKVATTIGFLAGMALFGAIAFVPLLLQVTTGGSATSAGRILTPLYLTWVLASIVAARLLLRVGPRISTVVGTTAIFVAFSALPRLAVGSSRLALFADVALMGGGLGLSMLTLLLTVQHSVSRSELGVATSLNMFSRSIGGAVGVAIMGAIVAAGLSGSVSLAPGALETASLADLGPELRRQLVESLRHAFVSGAAAAGLAVVAAFWVPRFAGDVTPDPGAQLAAAEMGAVDPDLEPRTEESVAFGAEA